ncbi:MAG: thioredoxin domain-containing protein [Candidatus Micrarchaeota archaeon]
MDEHTHHVGKSDGSYVIAASFVLAAIILSASMIYAANGINANLAQINSGMSDIKTGIANIKINAAPPAANLAGTPTPQPAAPTPPPAQPGGKISLATGLSKGSNTAKIVLVEYSDFQCPFCVRHYTQTEGQINENYVDTGKVRLIYKHFPLDQIHPNARPAAAALECAKDQSVDLAWKFYDKLFTGSTALTADNFKAWAKEAGLDSGEFDACIAKSADKNAAIDAQMNEGSSNGITGTPGFLFTDEEGNVLNRISGAYPYEAFQQAFDQLLAA